MKNSEMMIVRTKDQTDEIWLEEFFRKRWLDEIVVVNGEVIHPNALQGFIAEEDEVLVGVITYRQKGSDLEVITLDSLQPGRGIGHRLMDAVMDEAKRLNCQRIFWVTTNDNLRALGFYQKIGFRLAALRVGAVEGSRILKPCIPLIGEDEIPIRDEIELEVILES